MIVKLFLSLLVSLSMGYVLIKTFLPVNKLDFEDLLMKLGLAVGLGFGITSCTYFLSLLSVGPHLTGVIVYEAGLFLILMLLFVRYRKNPHTFEIAVAYEKTSDDFKLIRILSIGFYFVLVLAFVNIVYMAILLPVGKWDAWAIWNMHARFIFRGGEYWRDAFSALLAPKHHPDYPLMLPLTVSRGWTYIGK